MSARDRSPRPAETLPVTLLPNAVLMAAPSPDRVKSLLIACAVYCALGAVVLGGARKVTGRTGPILDTVTFNPEKMEDPVVPVPRLDPPPPGGGTRPAGFIPIEPPRDANVVPVVVPNTLKLQDRSNQMAIDPGLPVGPAIPGAPPVTVAPPALPRSSAPVYFETRQIRVLQQVQPIYPALARLMRAQGAVELQMTIDEAGVPTQVTVVSGPQALLIDEAVRVARLWRFQPATVDGAPVPATFRLTVTFRLTR